jgi:hypothetical protein
MSTDREQWISAETVKWACQHFTPFTEKYTIAYGAYRDGLMKALEYSGDERVDPIYVEMGAALSPPQAVDEKGIREEAEQWYDKNFRSNLSVRSTVIYAYVQGRLQSQCPSAPQGDNWISVEAENKQLREALQWLVELKDLKDRIDAADTLVDKSVSYAKRMRYAEEKPKAWGRAKDILASRSVKGGNNQNESI